MKRTVKQLLAEKASGVWTCDPATPVFEAVRLMEEHQIGALPVVRDGKLAGIVSERDCVRRGLLRSLPLKETPVETIMTTRVVCVRPENTVEQCMALMTDNGFRHLPVLDGDRLVGMISMRDVVRSLLSEKEFLIRQLENYITSG